MKTEKQRTLKIKSFALVMAVAYREKGRFGEKNEKTDNYWMQPIAALWGRSG